MKLNESSAIPLYCQLREIFRELLRNGLWKEGQEIPSERELVETYGVSRSTVRQALNELALNGFIVRKQGKGTFVARTKIFHQFVEEPSFARQIKAQGLEPSSIVITAEIEQNTPKSIAKSLNLKNTDKTYHLMRVRLANNIPIALERLYIPIDVAPNLFGQDLENVAVFEYIKKDRQLELTHFIMTVEPVLINEFEASQLKTGVGSPALLLERIIYAEKRAIGFQKRIVRGDNCKFLLTMHNNPSLKEVLQLEFEVQKDLLS